MEPPYWGNIAASTGAKYFSSSAQAPIYLASVALGDARYVFIAFKAFLGQLPTRRERRVQGSYFNTKKAWPRLANLRSLAQMLRYLCCPSEVEFAVSISGVPREGEVAAGSFPVTGAEIASIRDFRLYFLGFFWVQQIRLSCCTCYGNDCSLFLIKFGGLVAKRRLSLAAGRGSLYCIKCAR